MRRAAVLLVLCLGAVPLAGATTTYDIAVDGTTATVNVSFELTADRAINFWRGVTWQLPDGAAVVAVRDTQGAIDDYTVRDGELRFNTNRGPARTREVVTVVYRHDNAVEEEYRGVDLLQFRLSGFPDERTQVAVETARPLLAESHSYGFRYSLGPRAANYSGTGPVNLYLSVSDSGDRYDHFVLFGDGNLTRADQLFDVAPAVTGFLPQLNRYPVIVLPDQEYDETVDAWSAGQYRTGGLIFIRESVMEQDSGAAVVMHEVMHGFNEHALRWTDYQRPWFDEGTARYVEYLIKDQQGLHSPEIFGDRVEWRCGERRTCYYEPWGTPDQLWDYYQSGDDFMESWSPMQAETDDRRRFGYAYAELLVRNYVRTNSPDALQPVYERLHDVNRRIRDPRQATETILTAMNTDFTPCKADVRAAFDRCLEAVNDMTPTVPNASVGTGAPTPVTIDPIKRPETGPQHRDRALPGMPQVQEGTLRLTDAITTLITRLSDALNGMLSRLT